MFDTLADVAFGVALVLPGFLVVQLSERRRPSRPPGGDLELVLRGLVYALLIQAAAALSTWLPHLAHEVNSGNVRDHFTALAVYGIVVCVAVPTLVGLLLGTWLRSAESGGALRWWHYALGGRDVRRAWDYTFSQHDGSWMRIVLRDPGDKGPRAILGKYGRRSWASQSPAEPDLYLQEVWPTDDDGQVSEEDLQRGSAGGMWINADQIARIEVLAENSEQTLGRPVESLTCPRRRSEKADISRRRIRRRARRPLPSRRWPLRRLRARANLDQAAAKPHGVAAYWA